MHRKLTALCVALFVTTGFAAPADPLSGNAWIPVELNAESFAPIAEIFVTFEIDGAYSGNDGCNAFRGRFVTNEQAILFSPAITTRMACPENIMQQAFGFLQALAMVRLFERDGTALALSNAGGDVILRLAQSDTD